MHDEDVEAGDRRSSGLGGNHSDIIQNPHKAEGVELDPAFARIVERVFINQDADKVYERLEADLRVGEKLEHPGALVRALDKAETNARLAHRLYITAKIERERWELENEIVFGGMRSEATRHLQIEKDEGKRNKQITDADVVSMSAQMFTDQYVAQEMTRRKVKAMEETLSHLSEVWLSRCRTLQVMLGRAR